MMADLFGSLNIYETLVGYLSTPTLIGYSAYQVAVQQGFPGTEEEWLESLKGESIVLRANGTMLQWCYQSEADDETAWRDLLDMVSAVQAALAGYSGVFGDGTSAITSFTEEHGHIVDVTTRPVSGAVDRYERNELITSGAVWDALHGYDVSMYHLGNLIASGDDLNNYIFSGKYECRDSSTVTNAPPLGRFSLFVVKSAYDSYIIQIAIGTSVTWYTRRIDTSSGTYQNWRAISTESSEGDAVGSVNAKGVAKGENYAVTNGTIYLVFFSHPSVLGLNGVYFFRGGTSLVVPIVEAQRITITLTAENFSWTCSEGENPQIYIVRIKK